jgi:hypothetical protein
MNKRRLFSPATSAREPRTQGDNIVEIRRMLLYCSVNMEETQTGPLNARQASAFFGVKLATWKRWSREFLPPDRKARMRSGRTRLLSLDQAFQVFLGAHLVSFLRYSIPEARDIMAGLKTWFLKNGIFPGASGADPEGRMKRLQIIIHEKDDGTFCCESKYIVSVKPSTGKRSNVIEEVYEQEWLPGATVEDMLRIRFVGFRVLEIGKVRESFDRALGKVRSRRPRIVLEDLPE